MFVDFEVGFWFSDLPVTFRFMGTVFDRLAAKPEAFLPGEIGTLDAQHPGAKGLLAALLQRFGESAGEEGLMKNGQLEDVVQALVESGWVREENNGSGDDAYLSPAVASGWRVPLPLSELERVKNRGCAITVAETSSDFSGLAEDECFVRTNPVAGVSICGWDGAFPKETGMRLSKNGVFVSDIRSFVVVEDGAEERAVHVPATSTLAPSEPLSLPA